MRRDELISNSLSFFSSFFKSCSWDFLCNKSCLSPDSIVGSSQSKICEEKEAKWLNEVVWWIFKEILKSSVKSGEAATTLTFEMREHNIYKNIREGKLVVISSFLWRNNLRGSNVFHQACQSLSGPAFWERWAGKTIGSATPFRGTLGICGREVKRYGDGLRLKATSGSDCRRSDRRVSVQSSLLTIPGEYLGLQIKLWSPWSLCLFQFELHRFNQF